MTVSEDESVCLGLLLDMTETQCMHQHPNFGSQPLCPLVPLFYSTSDPERDLTPVFKGVSELLASGGYLEG